jgi:hypothetical protein
MTSKLRFDALSIPRTASLRAALGVLCTALLAACSAPAPRGDAAASPTPEIEIRRIDKVFALDKSIRRVEIVNRYGEINVKDHDRREVGLHAVVQRLPPDFVALDLEETREGGTLRLEPKFPGGSGARPGRIDMAVYVPKTLGLALATDDGRISVKKWGAPVSATSESGEIRASSYGRLDLRTDSGPIRAIAIGKRWPGEARVTTGSGRIVLLVPTFGDIALDARTAGKLGTNFGLSVHADGGTNTAHARYGRGTSPLIVHSNTGEIVLEQLVLMEQDAVGSEDDD